MINMLKFAELVALLQFQNPTQKLSNLDVLKKAVENCIEQPEVKKVQNDQTLGDILDQAQNNMNKIMGDSDHCNLIDLMSAMQKRNKIEAIRAYRTLTGFGLKESKNDVERFWNLSFDQKNWL